MTRSRSRPLALALLALAVAIAVPVAAASPPVDKGVAADATARRGERARVTHPAFPGPHRAQVGASVQGRPIVAINRVGAPDADRTLVVVGVIHGDERHGRAVANGLLTATLPRDLDLWIVPTINPDGETLGTRRNAAGVDLNRNWPANWETGTFFSSGRYASGDAPASEPETRAMMEFLAVIDPDVTIWYHSPWNRVDCDVGRVGRACQDYATAVGAFTGFAPRPGTATDWLMTAGLGVSFVHEFSGAPPAPATLDRHVRAVLALAP